MLGIGASADAPENNVVIDELAACGASLAWFDRYALPRRRALDPFTRQQYHAALLQESCRMGGRRFFRAAQHPRAGFNDGHGSSRPGLDHLAGHLDADPPAAPNQAPPSRHHLSLVPTAHPLPLF